jgi:hypothetical protein
MTMFMLPEGTINYTFKDIPRWAKAAKDAGINAVQISGWQRGGHDNGYPNARSPKEGRMGKADERCRAQGSNQSGQDVAKKKMAIGRPESRADTGQK